MTEKRRYRAEEEREQVKPKKRERYKPIKDYKGRCKHKKEREKDLSGPPPITRRHGQGQEGLVFEFIKDGVPCVGPDGELRVVESIVGISALSFYLEALANEKVLLEGVFIFCGESGNNGWFFPFYGAGGAVTSMF